MLHYIKALLHLGQGAFEASIAEWELGLEQAREIPHRVLQGAMFSHLGIALRETGRGREAVDTLRRGRLSMSKVAPSMASPSRSSTSATPCSAAAIRPRRESCSTAATTWRDASRTPGARPGRPAWGRARLAFADGRPDLAVEECWRATALLQNREFPWALVQLWEFYAETATAAGRLEVADKPRAAARQVTITNS
jgi:hypothetical protein